MTSTVYITERNPHVLTMSSVPHVLRRPSRRKSMSLACVVQTVDRSLHFNHRPARVSKIIVKNVSLLDKKENAPFQVNSHLVTFIDLAALLSFYPRNVTGLVVAMTLPIVPRNEKYFILSIEEVGQNMSVNFRRVHISF